MLTILTAAALAVVLAYGPRYAMRAVDWLNSQRPQCGGDLQWVYDPNSDSSTGFDRRGQLVATVAGNVNRRHR
jgi:hypothetical protein